MNSSILSFHRCCYDDLAERFSPSRDRAEREEKMKRQKGEKWNEGGGLNISWQLIQSKATSFWADEGRGQSDNGMIFKVEQGQMLMSFVQQSQTLLMLHLLWEKLIENLEEELFTDCAGFTQSHQGHSLSSRLKQRTVHRASHSQGKNTSCPTKTIWMCCLHDYLLLLMSVHRTLIFHSSSFLDEIRQMGRNIFKATNK